jgi:hypothetical protein
MFFDARAPAVHDDDHATAERRELKRPPLLILPGEVREDGRPTHADAGERQQEER